MPRTQRPQPQLPEPREPGAGEYVWLIEPFALPKLCPLMRVNPEPQPRGALTLAVCCIRVLYGGSEEGLASTGFTI